MLVIISRLLLAIELPDTKIAKFKYISIFNFYSGSAILQFDNPFLNTEILFTSTM